jgi:hypothetical protein
MEKIRAVRRGPRYILVFRTKIYGNKDKAKKAAQENLAEYQVFSNGSEIDGQVGAAAVLYCNGQMQQILRYHLGPALKYGIVEAKLVGEIMAAFMLSRPGLQYMTATISADNTATIHNTRNQTPRGAHYLVNEIHHWMELAMGRGPQDRDIGLVWTPGYVGVEGNKKADEHAKRVAKGESSMASSLLRLLH